MEPWAREKVWLVWRYHQLLSGFLAKGHLPRVANGKGDNQGPDFYDLKIL